MLLDGSAPCDSTAVLAATNSTTSGAETSRPGTKSGSSKATQTEAEAEAAATTSSTDTGRRRRGSVTKTATSLRARKKKTTSSVLRAAASASSGIVQRGVAGLGLKKRGFLLQEEEEEEEEDGEDIPFEVDTTTATATTTTFDSTTTRSRMRNSSSANRGVSILPRIGNPHSWNGAAQKEVGGAAGSFLFRKKFGWRWLFFGGTVLFLFVWLFGPRERREKVLGAVYPHGGSKYGYEYEPVPPPGARLSFSTDLNPSSTAHCTKPYKPSLPLVQWALMLDAGSTGSRIHVYKFHNCGPSPEYEYEVFKMTQPGLSSFGDDPEGGARSLDVLMDEAVRVVPEKLRRCAPVALKATAGLRLLGADKSKAILDKVKERLETAYPFPVMKPDGVVIMDGKDEGVYAWITANYLLNTIRPGKKSVPGETYAVLDLGGASTQIVFEPSIDESSKVPFEDGDHKYLLHFGANDHVLYQHSYLGYGLMLARQSVHKLADFLHAPSRSKTHDGDVNNKEEEVANPCLAQGMSRLVAVEDPISECTPGQDTKRNVTMIGADVGSFEACNRLIELVIAKDAICHVKPCSFNGVYQPSILDTFPTGKILLLSYFYDRMAPLLPQGTTTQSISLFKTYAERVCAGPQSWQKHWGDNPAAMEELEGRPEYCLDLTFMHALLRLGYEFEGERTVRLGKQVEGTELGWCLGAAITMLEGGVECLV